MSCILIGSFMRNFLHLMHWSFENWLRIFDCYFYSFIWLKNAFQDNFYCIGTKLLTFTFALLSKTRNVKKIIIFSLTFYALMKKKLQNYLFLNRFFLIACNLEEQKNPYSHFPFNAGCEFITQRKFFYFQVLHCLKQITFFRLVHLLQIFLCALFFSSVHIGPCKTSVNLAGIL